MIAMIAPFATVSPNVGPIVSKLYVPPPKSRSRADSTSARCPADSVSVEKFKKKLSALPANFKKPFRDGEEKADLVGFGAGKVFSNLSSKMRPGLIFLDRTPITDPEDFYPGCYARATITAYAYDNVGKGVALGLQNLQKIKDGDRLDSRTNPEDDFSGEVDDAWLGEDGADPLA